VLSPQNKDLSINVFTSNNCISLAFFDLKIISATKARLKKLFGHNFAKRDKKICKNIFIITWRWNQFLHVAWRNFVIRITLPSVRSPSLGREMRGILSLNKTI
jgi:hypothetical protein